MNMVTKHEVLRAHLKKWLACKEDTVKRGKMTRELAKTVQMHTKSVSRSMRRLQLKGKATRESRGRKTYYTKDVDAALCDIWDMMGRPCAESVHPMITEYVAAFLREGAWTHSDKATGKLFAVSLGTVKNKIRVLREKHDTVRGKSATVSSPLKGMIPIRKSHTWSNLPPGYVQIDTVVHCGDILTADVIYSLGSVDFATYWIEYTAQWNKGEEATWESFNTIRKRFPFGVIEAHPDTGNEFINYHFHKYATKENIKLTRSEPYKKNDNMCIEERNGSIARKHLGYARLDALEMVETVAEIMRLASMLHNHFIPVRRMISKVRIGAKWKRTFEKTSRTAYQRVLAHTEVSEKDKTKLRAVHEALNPLALKREIDALKEKLSRMVRTRTQA